MKSFSFLTVRNILLLTIVNNLILKNNDILPKCQNQYRTEDYRKTT